MAVSPGEGVVASDVAATLGVVTGASVEAELDALTAVLAANASLVAAVDAVVAADELLAVVEAETLGWTAVCCAPQPVSSAAATKNPTNVVLPYM